MRVRGILEGTSYQALTQGGRSFPVYGGDILLQAIKDEDIRRRYHTPDREPIRNVESYEVLLNDFTTSYYTTPRRYHLLIEDQCGNRRLRMSPLTPDLQEGHQGLQVGDRTVNWFWSESTDFYVKGWLNGLYLAVSLAQR